jgi:DUF4097 and DUF4098 domain-containing protein YvlB
MLAASALTLVLLAQSSASESAATSQSRETRAPQTDQTVNVGRGARLTVSNFAGEVLIRGWDRDQVRVIARHGPRSKVNIRQSATVVTISSDTHGAVSVDYEITAPAWMPIKVDGHFNYVSIDGAQSDVSAETVRGDVVIKGGSGTVVGKSIQGEVHIDGARGKITASSVNEGIRIARSTGDISVETTNGHIAMTGITSPSVEASTVNGHIDFDGTIAPKGRYRFATHNGNITMGIPEDSNLTLTVRTYNGDFTSSLNLNGPPKSEVRRGRRVTYTLGNGSAEMDMETFGGSIRIRRPGSSSTGRQRD